MNNILCTERLILRKWKDSDAEQLFIMASVPEIGKGAGWLPHEDVSYSKAIIRAILSADGEFAITDKKSLVPIGSIGIRKEDSKKRGIVGDKSAEIGYWIGRDYWNRGFATEALRAVIEYGFKDLKMKKIYCAYFDDNVKSRRVLEKCGLYYSHHNEHLYNSMRREYYDETVMCIRSTEYI